MRCGEIFYLLIGETSTCERSTSDVKRKEKQQNLNHANAQWRKALAPAYGIRYYTNLRNAAILSWSYTRFSRNEDHKVTRKQRKKKTRIANANLPRSVANTKAEYRRPSQRRCRSLTIEQDSRRFFATPRLSPNMRTGRKKLKENDKKMQSNSRVRNLRLRTLTVVCHRTATEKQVLCRPRSKHAFHVVETTELPAFLQVASSEWAMPLKLIRRRRECEKEIRKKHSTKDRWTITKLCTYNIRLSVLLFFFFFFF